MNKFSTSLITFACISFIAACGDDRKVVYVQQPSEYTQPAVVAQQQYQQPTQAPIIINNVPPAVQEAPGMSPEGAFLLGALGGAAVGHILSQPPMQPRYSYESDSDYYHRKRKYDDINRAYAEKNRRYIAERKLEIERSNNAELKQKLAEARRQNYNMQAQLPPPVAKPVTPPAAIAPTVPMKPPAVVTGQTQQIVPNRVNTTQMPAPTAATGAYSQPNRVMPTQITVAAPKPPAAPPATPARVAPTKVTVTTTKSSSSKDKN